MTKGWGKKVSKKSSAADQVTKKRTPPTPGKRAQSYAAKGWRVVPMHTISDGCCSCPKGPNCSKPGKHPQTNHGVNDATTKIKTIKKWWSKHPGANVGIAAGKASKILVLDIDPRNGGTETFEALKVELGPLPKTVASYTGGGGKHRVFAYPAFDVRKDTAGKKLGAGVDILSGGSIMVAPPSVHISGGRYRWICGKSFKDLVPAALPEKWLAKLKGSEATEKPNTTSETIVEGARNTTLTSLAGKLHRDGLSAPAVLAALKAENAAKCSPPLDKTEVKGIVASVTKYAAAPGGGRPDDAEKLLSIVLTQHFDGGKHLIFGPDGQFWHYTGKLWVPVQEKWVDGRILESIQGSPFQTRQVTASLVGQVKTLLSAKLSATGDPLGFLTDPPSVINCANCEVWIANDGTVEQRPHSPTSYLRHCLDITYDPDAECPEYDKAVLGIFAKASEPKILRRHWNELVGYLIQPRRNIPLIVIMIGGGDNGKTVLTRTVVRLVGHTQVQAQRVEELEKNRFAMGSLLGKLMFLDDDVRAGARLPDGILKTISEAKEVTGENKYKPSFNFVVRTVPILLCNNVPSLADLSHGMRRRLMVIPFDRQFTAEDKDESLFERIWANELPGVLNQALKGYARLLKRKHFKIPQAVTEAGNHWLEQANPIPAFLDDKCIKKVDAECWMQGLYAAYKEWATKAGYTMTQNQLSFRRNLEHLGYEAIHGNRGQKILGISLRV